MFKAAACPALSGGLRSACRGEGSREIHVTVSARNPLSRKDT